MSADSPQAPRAARSPLVRVIGLLIVTPLLMAVLLAVAVALVLATPTGSRMALEWLAGRAPDKLAIEQVRGTAWTGLSVARARWADRSITVEVSDLALQLNWSSLLRGTPVIDRIEAGTLRVALPASDSPPTPPSTLRLPFDFEIRALNVAAIAWTQGEQAAFTLGPVSLSASRAGRRYRVEGLAALAHDVRLRDGLIELDDEAPFALRARGGLQTNPARLARLDAQLRTRLPDQPLTVSLDIAGPLDRLQVTADAAYGDARLQARASIEPFEPLPVRRVEGRIDALNPSRFGSDLPVAAISGTFVARPAESAVEVEVINGVAGTIDQRRLPVERARGSMVWRDQALQVDDLDLRMLDGGQITGTMTLDATRRITVQAYELPSVRAALRISGLVPAAQRAGWPGIRLQAQMQIDHERIEISMPDLWGDSTLALSAAVRLQGNRVGIERFEATLPEARARLAGALELASPHAFSVAGAIEGVDPRRVLERLGLQAPRQSSGALHGEVRLKGELTGSAPQAEADLALRESRIAGQPLAATMTARYEQARRRMSVDARLDWGGNDLALRGALGLPDDRLKLSARLNRPDRFDHRLSGDLLADAVVGGTFERPHLAVRATARRLSLAGAGGLDSGELTAEVDDARALVETLRSVLAGAGPPVATLSGRDATEGGALRLNLSAGEIRVAGQSVQTLRARAEGTLASHSVEVAARALNHDIAITGAGQLPRQEPLPATTPVEDAAPAWSIRLTSFTTRGLIAAALAGSGQIEVLRGAVRVRDTAFGADGGTLALDDVFVSATALRARGRASGLSLRPLIDWLEGGASGRPPSSGSVADARSDAAERLRALRLDARWALSGPAWDRLDGELVAALKAGPRASAAGHLAGDPDPVIGDNRIDMSLTEGRLSGEANIAIPSLRFSRRYTAPDWTLDGELLFSGQIRGTLRSPELVGALRAERLTLFNRSLGWRLRDGRIAARFDGRELAIDSLRFASGDGAMTVAGALRLTNPPDGSSRAASDLPVEGRLQLDARRLPVPLGPGQRLLLSGLTDLVAAGGQLSWTGSLRADDGLIELRSGGVPELPADIRVLGEASPPKIDARGGEGARGWTPRVGADLKITLGDSLKVRGGGVDARLGGELTLSGVLPAAPRVRGLVDVRDGTFSAYGRRLEITRGLIRFAGELDNPVLDIVAMRREQQVEAGVAVTGSALAPRIRLVSEPDLPDAQKLAWLVLGMGLDDVSNAGQARALSEAALALLGRNDEGLIAGLTQRLGIDAVSLGAAGASPRDRLGTARLAPPMPGAATSSGVPAAAVAGAARQDVVTVSKRLSSRLTLSYERGLSGLWNLVRLQYDISRRLSLRAQSGSENALDLLYFWWFD